MITSRSAPPLETAFDPESLVLAPQDPLYSIVAAFEADDSDKKVDLGVGAYRDNDAKPWILPVVRKAEEIYRLSPTSNHEYLPIAGLPSFTLAAQRLILGKSSTAIRDDRVCTFQAISGTGALHLGGLLLSKFLPRPVSAVYVSDPSWPIHDQVFSTVGLPVKHYPYFNEETKTLDFEDMTTALDAAPEGSIVILQICAHNPTGVDPSSEQWMSLARSIKRKKQFPFFDCAYQGFATGQLSADNFPIRHFVDEGFEILIAQSFAKNLGLYGQRAGALHYVASRSTSAQAVVARVHSQLAILQRAELSSHPSYGAQIASIVLSNDHFFADWEKDLQTMSDRIIRMRISLRRNLEQLHTPGSWDHITNQIGMFSFTGLREKEVLELRHKWHIYMAETGRISIAGLNTRNVRYVATAIDDVVRRLRP